MTHLAPGATKESAAAAPRSVAGVSAPSHSVARSVCVQTRSETRPSLPASAGLEARCGASVARGSSNAWASKAPRSNLRRHGGSEAGGEEPARGGGAGHACIRGAAEHAPRLRARRSVRARRRRAVAAVEVARLDVARRVALAVVHPARRARARAPLLLRRHERAVGEDAIAHVPATRLSLALVVALAVVQPGVLAPGASHLHARARAVVVEARLAAALRVAHVVQQLVEFAATAAVRGEARRLAVRAPAVPSGRQRTRRRREVEGVVGPVEEGRRRRRDAADGAALVAVQRDLRAVRGEGGERCEARCGARCGARVRGGGGGGSRACRWQPSLIVCDFNSGWPGGRCGSHHSMIVVVLGSSCPSNLHG